MKFLVEHVTQFPSDADLNRYINTLSDKVFNIYINRYILINNYIGFD